MTANTVHCPTGPYASDGTPHTIIGCGALILDDRDDEGLIDCPQCGIWFNPLEESDTTGQQPPTTTRLPSPGRGAHVTRV